MYKTSSTFFKWRGRVLRNVSPLVHGKPKRAGNAAVKLMTSTFDPTKSLYWSMVSGHWGFKEIIHGGRTVKGHCLSPSSYALSTRFIVQFTRFLKKFGLEATSADLCDDKGINFCCLWRWWTNHVIKQAKIRQY